MENQQVVQAEEVSVPAEIEALILRTAEVAATRAVEAVIVQNAACKLCAKPTSAKSGEAGTEESDRKIDFAALSYSELCSFLDNNPGVRLA